MEEGISAWKIDYACSSESERTHQVEETMHAKR